MNVSIKPSGFQLKTLSVVIVFPFLRFTSPLPAACYRHDVGMGIVRRSPHTRATAVIRFSPRPPNKPYGGRRNVSLAMSSAWNHDGIEQELRQNRP